MRNRSFSSGSLNHCYERTAGHGVLFYTVRDHLVFFTVFCTMARRHKLQVLKLVQMPDHLHHATIARTLGQLCGFHRDYTSVFAKEYNRTFGLSGSVFETPFSSAVKKFDKDVRTNLIYLDNNAVERKLVKMAEDYQWCYLAYATSDHPFSDKLVLSRASMPLRRALERVRLLRSQDRYLGYRLLEAMFDSLPDDRERAQLTDAIVRIYSIIDHAAATRYFGGYEKELLTAHSVRGAEYDISEGFVGKSDAFYARFTKILLQRKLVQEIHEVLTMPAEEKQRLLSILLRETSAPEKQICAYLHLPVEIKR